MQIRDIIIILRALVVFGLAIVDLGWNRADGARASPLAVEF